MVRSVFKYIKEGARRIRNVFKGPANTEPKALRAILNKIGHLRIVRLFLGRKPLHKYIQLVGNVISKGGLDETRKKLGYDDIYHNYLIVLLEDGSFYKTEKDEVVKLYRINSIDHNDKITEIPVKHHLTLKQLIEQASKNDSDFWKYSARNKNCQLYTSELINRNGLTPDDPTLQKAVEPQDAETLVKSLPTSIQDVPKLVTDIAGATSRLITGDGVKTHCLKCKVKTKSKNTQKVKTNCGKQLYKSKCSECGFSKSSF